MSNTIYKLTGPSGTVQVPVGSGNFSLTYNDLNKGETTLRFQNEEDIKKFAITLAPEAQLKWYNNGFDAKLLQITKKEPTFNSGWLDEVVVQAKRPNNLETQKIPEQDTQIEIDPIKQSIFDGFYNGHKFTPTEQNINHYLNLYKKELESYDPQKWFYEGIDWMKKNPYRAGLEIASYVPGVDVVADGLMAIDDYNNGDKIGAGVGAASILLPAFLDKPLKYIKKGYDWAKDAYWVTKKYDIINSGLNSLHINDYKKALSDPSFVRQSFEKYPNLNEFDIEVMKDKVPKMDYLINKYNLSNDLHDGGRTLSSDLNFLSNDNYGLNQLESEFRYADRVKKIYQKQLEQVYEKFPILGDIAKESPQYLRQIHKDMVNNNIINQEDYIKGLIDQSNTFVRAVTKPLGDDILYIRGINHGVLEKDFHFGNPAVLGSGNYGNYIGTFTPKNRTLTGPPETWWSQRFPKFDDPNISINTNGMHNISRTKLGMQNTTSTRYLNSMVNPAYGRIESHNFFKSPAENSTIADQFNVQWTTLPRGTRYTLGYNQGGKLNKRFK